MCTFEQHVCCNITMTQESMWNTALSRQMLFRGKEGNVCKYNYHVQNICLHTHPHMNLGTI